MELGLVGFGEMREGVRRREMKVESKAVREARVDKVEMRFVCFFFRIGPVAGGI